MSYCDAEGECRDSGRAVDASEAHYFAGYGFLVRFHPKCCPGSLDGSLCDREHPEGWSPEQPELVEQLRREELERASTRAVRGAALDY